MSIELHVFLQDSKVPSRTAWQSEIEQLAFPTVLDTTLDLRKDTGFSPTTYAGKAAGFEFDLEPAAHILESYDHIAQKIGNRDMCATFRWGSDLNEMCAALSAAAALTKLTDGIYFDPQDDSLYNAEEAVNAVRKELKSV